MRAVLWLLRHGLCVAVGAGTAWTAIALGWQTGVAEAALIEAGATVGLAAPWVYAFAGRQLGASGDVLDRYEQRRLPAPTARGLRGA